MVDRAARATAGDEGMPLIEHLRELRSRIIKSLIAIAIGGVVAFFLYDAILDALTEPYCQALIDNGIDRPCSLAARDPLEGFGVRMKITGYGGLILALPVVLWQIWRFVTPGLYAHEKRYAIPFLFSSLVLFACGAGIAYWTIPKALDFLIGVGGEDIEPFFAPGKYISLITLMIVVFGAGFLFPVLLVFLELVGVITPRQLRRSRRYAVVGIVVVVAVATPSGDPISLLALSVPMWVFYELAILIGWLVTRRRNQADADAS
jgi:sec-independent protein translocase protein TatC